MATVKKGILTGSPEWWKHLKWTKRPFWHAERRAAQRDVKERVDEAASAELDDAEIDYVASFGREYDW